MRWNGSKTFYGPSSLSEPTWHISEFVKAAESLEKCRAEFCVRGLKGHG
jgi:hypothetical protein